MSPSEYSTVGPLKGELRTMFLVFLCYGRRESRRALVEAFYGMLMAHRRRDWMGTLGFRSRPSPTLVAAIDDPAVRLPTPPPPGTLVFCNVTRATPTFPITYHAHGLVSRRVRVSPSDPKHNAMVLHARFFFFLVCLLSRLTRVLFLRVLVLRPLYFAGTGMVSDQPKVRAAREDERGPTGDAPFPFPPQSQGRSGQVRTVAGLVYLVLS